MECSVTTKETEALLDVGVIGAPELARVTPCSLLHENQQWRVARMCTEEPSRWTGELANAKLAEQITWDRAVGFCRLLQGF